MAVAWVVGALCACGASTDLDRGEPGQAGSSASVVDASGMDSARPDGGARDARADAVTHDAAQDGATPGLDAAMHDAAVDDAATDGGDAADCGAGVAVDGECVLPSVTLIEPAHADPNDLFGAAVALSDDTLVVGAPGESSGATAIDGDPTDNSAPSSGAVYVYTRQGSGWVLQAYLKASDSTAEARFGTSVAISGDIVAVGAPGASQTRAAYVFQRVGNTWSQVAALRTDSWTWEYSISVAVAGETVVVGAPNGETSGVAHVFVRGEDAWAEQAVLRSNREHPYDGFGADVAIEGDVIVVGAPGDDSDALGVNGDESNHRATDSGAAHVFVRNGETWTRQAYLKPLAAPACFRCGTGRSFGGQVAIQGGIVAVGATNEQSNAIGINGVDDPGDPIGAGAVYLFARDGSDGSRWGQIAHVRAQNPDTATSFGVCVAISDRRLVVGAWLSAGASDRAFSFAQQNGRVTQRRILRAPGGRAYPGDSFGLSVAVSGHTIAMGTWDYELDPGAVYVFEDP